MAGRLSRREVIAGAGASAMVLSGSGFVHTAPMARGVVFEDRRGDGRRQPTDAGIPGIMVSNGRDVVRTAGDGSWSLAVEPGDSVFVIKPSDWSCHASPGGVPRFSYLHQPDGSPADLDSRFPLIAPTGALPLSLDFALLRQREARDFEAVLMSDTQPEDSAELDYVRDDIIAAVLEHDAAFGINHGDVVADDLSLYARYLQPSAPRASPGTIAPAITISTLPPRTIASHAKPGREPSAPATMRSSTAMQRSSSWTMSSISGAPAAAIAARSGGGSWISCAMCSPTCRASTSSCSRCTFLCGAISIRTTRRTPRPTAAPSSRSSAVARTP
jgi:hypothetical protein